MSSPEQCDWIASYLVRKSMTRSLPEALATSLNQNGVHQTVYTLGNVLDTAVYRELSRRMQATWNVRQHRKKHGNPMSIQMSKEAQEQLKKLAKKNGQSQVETLDKIISGAVSERKDEAEKIQRQRKKFEEKLKKQKEEAQQVEQIYKKSVAALMSAFAEELDKRCCYEAALGDTDSSLLDSADLDTYRVLVDKSIAGLAPTLSRLQMRRADVGPSLKEMMDERVRLYERNVLNHGSEDNG
jgi:hypothetical protein